VETKETPWRHELFPLIILVQISFSWTGSFHVLIPFSMYGLTWASQFGQANATMSQPDPENQENEDKTWPKCQ
jgi:hypothetical protein